ncbi:MAG: dephospho-CoA kinase [Pseudomonadota bacterium]
MSLKVGLTGGIGSGKSAAAAMFAALGAHVIDSDHLARAFTEIGQPAYAAIVQHFGAGICLPDGNLDRARLRRIIFEDAEQKRWLEHLLHPMIREELFKHLEAPRNEYILLVIPLLVERGWGEYLDRVCVIDVPESVQIIRACHRDNMTPALAERIIQQQVSRSERLAAADDIIDNTQDLDALKKRVEALHIQYSQLAQNYWP